MNQTPSPLIQKLERYFKTDMKYLIMGGTWLGVGQATSMAMALIGAIAFANLLPKETYGTYKYILSLIALVSIPTLSGMNEPINQSIARGHNGAYLPGVYAKLKWGSLGSIASVLLGLYYLIYGNDTTLAAALFIAAPFIPLIEAYTLWGAVLGGKKLFKESAYYNGIVQVGAIMGMLTTLLLTSNILAIIASYFVFTTATRYWVHRRVLKAYPEAAVVNDVERAVHFGKNISFISILGILFAQLDIILLWHFFGATQVAVYAFAIATTTPIKSFFKSLVNLAHPKFAAQDASIIQATLNKKILKSFLIIAPLTILYIIVLPYAYKLFFPQYLDTVIYAQALGLIFFFFPGKLQSVAILTRLDRRPTYKLSIINPIISGILLLALIPPFGVWGGIIATILQYVFTTATAYYYFRKLK